MSAAPAVAVEQSTTIDPARTREALEIFTAIAENWGLSSEQQIILLGSPGRSTFFKWKKEGGVLPSDTQERISHLYNIHKALEILIPDTKLADEWIKRPNRAFDNEAPLDRALTGLAGLYEVRRYLDAQRGG